MGAPALSVSSLRWWVSFAWWCDEAWLVFTGLNKNCQVVIPAGFEPATLAVETPCSSAELRARIVEVSAGIEPAAWSFGNSRSYSTELRDRTDAWS